MSPCSIFNGDISDTFIDFKTAKNPAIKKADRWKGAHNKHPFSCH